jgi:hypothetical protein
MYIIVARRWFDRKNGNTYHSCVVLQTQEGPHDPQLIGKKDFVYGYDDAYLQTALMILQEAGCWPAHHESLKSGMDRDTADFLEAIRQHDGRFFIWVNDVNRRKDL